MSRGFYPPFWHKNGIIPATLCLKPGQVTVKVTGHDTETILLLDLARLSEKSESVSDFSRQIADRSPLCRLCSGGSSSMTAELSARLSLFSNGEYHATLKRFINPEDTHDILTVIETDTEAAVVLDAEQVTALRSWLATWESGVGLSRAIVGAGEEFFISLNAKQVAELRESLRTWDENERVPGTPYLCLVSQAEGRVDEAWYPEHDAE
jgi:hypothetical protein